MGKLKKWQLGLIITLVILVLLGITAVTIWAVVFRDKDNAKYDYNSIDDFVRYEWYLGDKTINTRGRIESSVDLNKLFPNDDGRNSYSIKSNSDGQANLSGNKLSNLTGSRIIIRIDNQSGKVIEQEFVIIQGINVFNNIDFNKAIESGQSIVFQSNIALDASREGITYDLKSSLYGNGYKLNPTEHITSSAVKRPEKPSERIWQILFSITGNDLVFRDLYIFGTQPEANSQVDINEFAYYGILVNVTAGSTITIENCVLENSNRQILVSGGKVNINGCYIRNAADACISLETTSRGKTDVVMTNNLVANAIVSCVLIWGTENVTTADRFVRLEIVGFLDLYNWKEGSTAQLLPSYDQFAGAANPIISSSLNDKKYQEFFYMKNGKKYAHLGILIIASGNLAANKAEVVGYEGAGFVRRAFPLPSLGSMVLNTCDIIGFDQKCYFKPGDKIPSDIFDDLKYGRKD